MQLICTKSLCRKLSTRRGHHIIFCLLSLLALLHLRYLISVFISDDKTIITEASFHNEKRPLFLPNFLLCFSKVFTYSKISEPDIKWLYNNSAPITAHFPRYQWSVNISDLILGTKFNGGRSRSSIKFKPVFFLPAQSCWKAMPTNVRVDRAGSVHTLELIINAAVYDDMMVDYKSPLVYLSIVPYLSSSQSDDFIPHTRSTVQISPGTFSSVGFSLTKMDSTYRTSRDERRCQTDNLSRERCLSMKYKAQFLQRCGFTANNIQNVTTSDFSECFLKSAVSELSCHLEPCKIELFRFSKSEAFIKFDKHLSALAIKPHAVQQLGRSLVTPARLNSQFNPYVRNSFQNVAYGMDTLTSKIAAALSRPRGHACPRSGKKKIRLAHIVASNVPGVFAERENLMRLRRSFVARSSKVFKNLVQSIMSFNERKPLFESTSPYYLEREIWNTENLITTNSIKKSIRQFQTMLSSAISDVDALRQQATGMIGTYNSLLFTQFIKRYSSTKLLHDYYVLLNSTIAVTEQAKFVLFNGDSPRIGHFAHQDAETKLTVVRPVSYNFSDLVAAHKLTNIYPNPWMQFAWLMNNGKVNPRSYPPIFGIIYGHDHKLVRIPVFVDIFCGFYHNYLGRSERFHGSKTSFSLSSSNLTLNILQDYALFVLNQLVHEYETESFFSLTDDGINGLERTSCARFSIFPAIYLKEGTSTSSALKSLERESCNYIKKGSGRAKHMIRMFASYANRLTHFEKTSKKFELYYSKYVTYSVGGAIKAVNDLRFVFRRITGFKVMRQSHKIFLINRLTTLSGLIRNTLSNDSEEHISHYLTKKGRILVGEIQIEISEISHELYQARTEYTYHRNIIRTLAFMNFQSLPIMRSVVRGIMTANFFSNFSAHKEILDNLNDCNEQKWIITETHLMNMLSMMDSWVVNTTILVTRAKRYTDSLLITKSFVRKNIMIVSLYYDSLTVLTETLAHPTSLKSLVGQIGAVLRIYIRMNVFRMLDILTSSIATLIGLKLWRLLNS